jgi:probable HAF family extracellular repeat protein
MPSGALRMLAVLGLTLSAGVAVATPAQASVTMIELQPLSPQAGVWPNAVNDHGVSVGGSNDRPTRWDRDGNVTDLGTLGGDRGVAVAINKGGVIVGQSETASQQHRATAWLPGGEIIDLGTETSYAVAVNDRGTIVGDGVTGGFLWTEGRLIPLRVPQVDYHTSVADVADDDTVVGAAWAREGSGHYVVHWDRDGRVIAVGPPNSFTEDAGGARWSIFHVRFQTDQQRSFTRRRDGRTTELEVLPGYQVNFAAAVNRHGAAVGGCSGDRERAVRWDRFGRVTELHGSDDYDSTTAVDINDAGTMVGYGWGLRDNHPVANAMRWDRYGRVTYLGTLPGTQGVIPRDMNNRGMVIGWVEIAPLHYRGVLWR